MYNLGHYSFKKCKMAINAKSINGQFKPVFQALNLQSFPTNVNCYYIAF